MINHGANDSARSVIEIGKRVDMDTCAGYPTINCCLASLSAGHFYFEDLFKQSLLGLKGFAMRGVLKVKSTKSVDILAFSATVQKAYEIFKNG